MRKINLNWGIASLLLLAGVLLYLVARQGSFSVALVTALFLLFYLLMVLRPKKVYG